MLMFMRLFRRFIDLVFFLGALFGLMFIMLIGADNDTVRSSVLYYFWIVAPLFAFGLLIGSTAILWDEFRLRRSRFRKG